MLHFFIRLYIFTLFVSEILDIVETQFFRKFMLKVPWSKQCLLLRAHLLLGTRLPLETRLLLDQKASGIKPKMFENML